MKALIRLLSLVLVVGASGCYSQRDSELIGQVKTVAPVTPLVCPDHVAVDISLGILRNGVGSMSTQDVWMRILNHDDVAKLKRAAESGELVKIRFDERRVTLCFPERNVLWVEPVR
jgi:hypothetical protein